MATPIKNIPTLHGKTARAFLKRAAEREQYARPTPIYTDREKKAYYKMLKDSGMNND